jgi:hypothetical protein
MLATFISFFMVGARETLSFVLHKFKWNVECEENQMGIVGSCFANGFQTQLWQVLNQFIF